MFLVKCTVLDVIGKVTKDMFGVRQNWAHILPIHFINYVTLDGFLVNNRKTLLYTSYFIVPLHGQYLA